MTTSQVIADPDTPDWHRLRLTGIGASEAAAAAGISEWRTPLDVFVAKRAEIAPREPTDAMRLGNLLEPVVQAEFIRRTGMAIVHSPVGLMRHHAYPWVLATPDAILCEHRYGPSTMDSVGEWKTTTWRQAAKLGEEDTDDIPVDWLCQVQQQMAVTGLLVAHVAALIDGRTLRTYQVESNPDLQLELIEAERELWERIENNDPPEPTWEHPAALRAVQECFRTVEEDRKQLSAEACLTWEYYEECGRKIADLKKEQSAAKAHVLYEIGNSGCAQLDDGRVIKRTLRPEAQVEYVRKAYVDVRAVKSKVSR